MAFRGLPIRRGRPGRGALAKWAADKALARKGAESPRNREESPEEAIWEARDSEAGSYFPRRLRRVNRGNRMEQSVQRRSGQSQHWRLHVQLEGAGCSRDLVLRDGVATAHDLELRSNGRREVCFLLADFHLPWSAPARLCGFWLTHRGYLVRRL